MKKALLHVLIAVLLGTVTMVAPLMLLKPQYYGAITSGEGENATRNGFLAFVKPLEGGEGSYEEGGALERVMSPQNLLSTGAMVLPSFLIALVAFLYFRKHRF